MAATKVLIIDDERLLVKSTGMALAHYGFEVKGALDGEEGLLAALEYKPDVILLDIMMPGMDGWQVLEKLKENVETRHIPVVIFTAREYSNGKALAVKNGAADYASKPFEPQELVTILENQIKPLRETINSQSTPP
jgi:DNA-binding response OmpR family regulator